MYIRFLFIFIIFKIVFENNVMKVCLYYYEFNKRRKKKEKKMNVCNWKDYYKRIKNWNEFEKLEFVELEII